MSRCRLPICPTTIDWTELQIGLTEVFDGKSTSESCDALNRHFSTLYTKTPIKGQQIYEKLKQVIIDNISRIFEQYKNIDRSDLLSIYDKNWKKFRFNSQKVHDICHYLNRTYIREAQDERYNNVYLIHELCFVIWKDAFHRTATEIRVTNAILDLIHQERTGSNVDRDIIKDVLQSYVELNIRNDVYVEWFENKFLQTTTDYYIAEAKARKIKALSRAEYLNTVDKWIIDEATRCAHYLDPSTEPKLRKNMENILINVCLKIVGDTSFQPFFVPRILLQIQSKQFSDEGLSDDWARVHSLNEHDDELVEMQDALKHHFTREGNKAIESAIGTIGQDPMLYVAKLQEVVQQQSDLVKQAFNNHYEAIGALDEAAQIYANKNADYGFPEILAKYCDELLKNSVRTDNERFDDLLDQAVLLFKYLRDTETFLEVYTRLLSERLIDETSIETENSFIGKLTSLCNFECTRHMGAMMNYAQISKGLTSDFRQAMSAQNNELLTADSHQVKTYQYFELPDIRVTVASIGPQCVHVGNDGMQKDSSKKLVDLRIVTIFRYGM